ncbi:hypothetical protein PoB_000673600 [Plakobranchus ocellatus]|uniref:Uncharacterized protein n=1 Tax=Plakobranchus ocellatus TaxID=259542 RepID=A0AAV3YCX1_9GAST|nr:hypothetical protein PoB_000673600 [Plakobranchus ocellatus]
MVRSPAHHSPNVAAELPRDAKDQKPPRRNDVVRVGNDALTVAEGSTTRGLICVRVKAATVQEAPMARGIIHMGSEIHRSSTGEEALKARGLVHMGIDAARSPQNTRIEEAPTTRGLGRIG